VASFPTAAVAGVVVAASGPSASSFFIGRQVGASERVVLKAGDVITVLDGAGTRVLRGAGTFTLTQAGPAVRRSAFAVLTEQRAASRMRTGAVRRVGGGGPVTRPNLWYVDVAQAGPTCLPSVGPVRLWRAATAVAATYTVSATGGASQRVSFGQGEALGTWNTATLPLAQGQSYRIAAPDGKSPGQLTFSILPHAASDPEALAKLLIERRCSAQVGVLAAAMTTMR